MPSTRKGGRERRNRSTANSRPLQRLPQQARNKKIATTLAMTTVLILRLMVGGAMGVAECACEIFIFSEREF